MFKVLGCLTLTLIPLVACSGDHGWTEVPTPPSSVQQVTYKIRQDSVSYVQNSKGERTIVVVVQRHVVLPGFRLANETELFKMHVAYADCEAGHGLLEMFRMNDDSMALSESGFAEGVNTDSGALARAACAAAGVHA